jgi:uncharacterized protein YdhG (YjbR/CyaY superfamily)
MTKTRASSKTRSGSVAAYIAAQPKATQRVLRSVRNAIRKAIPEAEELISYGIPAYRVRGYIALYFAGWREHYSLYPVNARLVATLKPQSASYTVNDKGTIRFPLDAPVPVKLIAAIAKSKAKEAAARRKARKEKDSS